MYTEDDMLQLGSLIPLKDGWFLDTESNKRFRFDDDGVPIDEFGVPLHEYGDK